MRGMLPPIKPGAGNAASDPIPATVDKKMSMQLSGLLINQRPLPEALTTLSLIGEVPIVADLDALAVIGLPKVPLSKSEPQRR